MTNRPPCPLHYSWICARCGHLRQQKNRRYDPAPVCARCRGTEGTEKATVHQQMSDYEACMADAARPLPVRREPSDPEMLRSLAELFNQISDPKVEYRIQRGFANRARPGSPGQTQAENAADDALLRIAMLVRTWAHDYPAPWMQPGAWGEWCPHGVQIVEADPDTTDPEGYPVGRVVDPWPCSAYDCTRAGYERAQAEEIDAYYDDLSLEVYGA